jgi:hypothetical protein
MGLKKSESMLSKQPDVDDSKDHAAVTNDEDILFDEIAPPGQEKQVKAIKRGIKAGDISKTYVDRSGKRKKTNPWAIAWSQRK